MKVMAGIVRKIDDLGRVAIPKELRKTMRLFGGDEIEIIGNPDNTITLRKYEPNYVSRLSNLRQELYEWMSANCETFDDELLENLDSALFRLQDLETE